MANEVYELDGEIFNSASEFLEALAHEYKTGDKKLVLSKLDDYGFEVSDIGVRPGGV